jgi:hypothetical protein
MEVRFNAFVPIMLLSAEEESEIGKYAKGRVENKKRMMLPLKVRHCAVSSRMHGRRSSIFSRLADHAPLIIVRVAAFRSRW